MDELREKVIEHLADCVEYLDGDSSRHWVFVRGNAVRAALQLLKAQEARVMTLEEVKRSAGEIVWVERRGTSETIVAQFAPYDTIDDSFYFFTIGNSVSYKAYSEDYYKDWCCWTSRPTDKQREAVKWE